MWGVLVGLIPSAVLIPSGRGVVAGREGIHDINKCNPLARVKPQYANQVQSTLYSSHHA